jgi:hypothetical protein
MKEFRLVIAGSRGFNSMKVMTDICDWALKNKVAEGYSDTIVSGTARGADTMGEQYAASNGYTVHRMPADWNAYGKRAGYIRNREMALYAKETDGGCIVFWDGMSPGTKHMINLCVENGLKCVVCEYLSNKVYIADRVLL